MGRAIVSFLFALLVVGLLAGLGAQVYQAGIAQGIIDAGRFPAGTTVPVVGGYGPHGFDFLGILFPILFLFLIFGLLRAAFSSRRGWGHGYGHGYGWGPGWDKGGMGEGPGSGGPSAWREERDRRMAELHRRLHEADSGTDPTMGGSGGSSTAGGSTTR